MSKITDAWNSASAEVTRIGKDLSTPIKWSDLSRGGATPYNKQTYDVKNHSYPSDLMASDSRYGSNYVIFYINVAVEGKLAQSKSDSYFVPESEVGNRDRGDLIAMNLSKTKLFAANAALNVGGAAVGSALGVGGASATVAGLATVGAGVTASIAASATRQQRRLKTAIAMHVPNQLSIRYGMQYEEDDTFALAAAAAGGSELLEAVKNGDTKNLTDTKGAAANIIANLTLKNSAGMSAATGMAANPKKEQVFKGVDFRKFTFDYQFFPRDEKEAANVLNIIKEFKYHMHPEFKDNNNFIYIYPSEFDIMYYSNGEENMSLHRHTSCVLEEMNVNYTPNGAFTTFANGMPTQINVTMGFRELALLTKDKVENGL
jgi:hypothetical protein